MQASHVQLKQFNRRLTHLLKSTSFARAGIYGANTGCLVEWTDKTGSDSGEGREMSNREGSTGMGGNAKFWADIAPFSWCEVGMN